jgi:hypothetical protein
MVRLKKVFISPPALVAIDYSENAGDIILAVDSSFKNWGAVLVQMVEKRRAFSRYESGMWSDVEQRYDVTKRECREVLKAFKRTKAWLYGVFFILEIDAKVLAAQFNRSGTDLPGALITRWLAWIRLFDFEIRYVPGTKHTAADGLSRRPRSKSDDEDEKHEMDINDYIDAELNCVRVFPIITINGEVILDGEYSD